MRFKPCLKEKIIIALFFTFLISSCNSKLVKIEETFIKRKWMLVEMNQIQSELLIKHKTYIDMTSKNDEASAYLGCNQFKFNYHFEGSQSFSATDVISTKIYCNETAKIEQVFSELIQKIDGFNIAKAHQLEFYINGKKKMRLVAADWD